MSSQPNWVLETQNTRPVDPLSVAMRIDTYGFSSADTESGGLIRMADSPWTVTWRQRPRTTGSEISRQACQPPGSVSNCQALAWEGVRGPSSTMRIHSMANAPSLGGSSLRRMIFPAACQKGRIR